MAPLPQDNAAPEGWTRTGGIRIACRGESHALWVADCANSHARSADAIDMRPDQPPRLLFRANLLRFRAFPGADAPARHAFKAGEQLA
jgi:hypothetical protein